MQSAGRDTKMITQAVRVGVGGCLHVCVPLCLLVFLESDYSGRNFALTFLTFCKANSQGSIFSISSSSCSLTFTVLQFPSSFGSCRYNAVQQSARCGRRSYLHHENRSKKDGLPERVSKRAGWWHRRNNCVALHTICPLRHQQTFALMFPDTRRMWERKTTGRKLPDVFQACSENWTKTVGQTENTCRLQIGTI